MKARTQAPPADVRPRVEPLTNKGELLSVGIQADTLKEALEKIIQDPTQDALRIVGAIMARELCWHWPDSGVARFLLDMLSIVDVERDYAPEWRSFDD